MIIWEGKGWLVAVIIFGCSLAANLLANWWTGSEDYWNKHQWTFALSLFAAGMICWYLGQRLEGTASRTLVDVDTGEEITHRPRHTLFWIPMKWCGVLAMVGAMIVSCLEVVKGR